METYKRTTGEKFSQQERMLIRQNSYVDLDCNGLTFVKLPNGNIGFVTSKRGKFYLREFPVEIARKLSKMLNDIL